MTDDPIKAAKILIVDDDLGMIRLLEEVLTGAGYINLSVTNDSRVAVAMFTDAQPDLVLLDLNMPYQDGYQVLHALRKDESADSQVPIIVVTADRKRETRIRAEA